MLALRAVSMVTVTLIRPRTMVRTMLALIGSRTMLTLRVALIRTMLTLIRSMPSLAPMRRVRTSLMTLVRSRSMVPLPVVSLGTLTLSLGVRTLVALLTMSGTLPLVFRRRSIVSWRWTVTLGWV